METNRETKSTLFPFSDKMVVVMDSNKLDLMNLDKYLKSLLKDT